MERAGLSCQCRPSPHLILNCKVSWRYLQLSHTSRRRKVKTFPVRSIVFLKLSLLAFLQKSSVALSLCVLVLWVCPLWLLTLSHLTPPGKQLLPRTLGLPIVNIAQQTVRHQNRWGSWRQIQNWMNLQMLPPWYSWEHLNFDSGWSMRFFPSAPGAHGAQYETVYLLQWLQEHCCWGVTVSSVCAGLF